MIGKTGWAVTPGESGWLCGRIYGDGSMEVYKFLTKEWAELCRQSMERLDEWENQRKWGSSTIAWTHGAQILTTSSLREMTMTHFQLENKPILVMDHNRQVIKLDVPAIIYLWLKTTWIPEAWNRLMWGEKGKIGRAHV